MIKLFKNKQTSSYTDSVAALRSSSIPVSNLGPKSYLVKIIFIFYIFQKYFAWEKYFQIFYIYGYNIFTYFTNTSCVLEIFFTSCVFTYFCRAFTKLFFPIL